MNGKLSWRSGRIPTARWLILSGSCNYAWLRVLQCAAPIKCRLVLQPLGVRLRMEESSINDQAVHHGLLSFSTGRWTRRIPLLTVSSRLNLFYSLSEEYMEEGITTCYPHDIR